MIGLAVLGSTGSIGAATLELVDGRPDLFRVVTLAARSDSERLRRQIARHRPELVSVASDAAAAAIREEFPRLRVAVGPVGLDRAATHQEVDTVVIAVVGAAGLAPTIAAAEAGKTIALATKEVLVAAGELVMASVGRTGARLRPIDSEHSALDSLLRGRSMDAVARLVLTASGGPLRQWSADRMAGATVEQVLDHPTWSMGAKISVDSATMMNKGLEIIEASRLFDAPEERIDILVHPQSLVHAMVVLRDGTSLTHLASRDMRLPIAAAIAPDDAIGAGVDPLDLAAVGRLDFEPLDSDRFPAPGLARAALRAGGELPAVLNAANEVAVEAFLEGRCSFDRIVATVEEVLAGWSGRGGGLDSVDAVLAVDAEARRRAAAVVGNFDPRTGVAEN